MKTNAVIIALVACVLMVAGEIMMANMLICGFCIGVTSVWIDRYSQ